MADRPRAHLEAPSSVPVDLEVNGEHVAVVVDPRTTLLDLLREHLDLTGAKKGCDHGQCGSCTVLVDGRRANSCLAFAVCTTATQVTTVEGLVRSPGRRPHPMQRAFLDTTRSSAATARPASSARRSACSTRPPRAGRVRCASLTDDGTGVVTGVVTLDDAEVKERMNGNLCRCGAYANLVAAIAEVAP